MSYSTNFCLTRVYSEESEYFGKDVTYPLFQIWHNFITAAFIYIKTAFLGSFVNYVLLTFVLPYTGNGVKPPFSTIVN